MCQGTFWIRLIDRQSFPMMIDNMLYIPQGRHFDTADLDAGSSEWLNTRVGDKLVRAQDSGPMRRNTPSGGRLFALPATSTHHRLLYIIPPCASVQPEGSHRSGQYCSAFLTTPTTYLVLPGLV